MTDRYTHFDPLEFAEVTNVQANLLKKKPKKPEAVENELPVLTLVKKPEAEKNERRRKAS